MEHYVTYRLILLFHILSLPPNIHQISQSDDLADRILRDSEGLAPLQPLQLLLYHHVVIGGVREEATLGLESHGEVLKGLEIVEFELAEEVEDLFEELGGGEGVQGLVVVDHHLGGE